VEAKNDKTIFPQEKALVLIAKERENEERIKAAKQAVETKISPPLDLPELPLPPNKDEIIKQLQEEIKRLNEENKQLQEEIKRLKRLNEEN
jgi:hypothetical protein